VLVAAAVCPHPPLLVPETTGSAAGNGADELDRQIWRLRAECLSAVRELAEAGPDLIVVVGGGTRTSAHPEAAVGSLRRFGVPFTTGAGEPSLPLSLTVGRWLVGHCPDPAASRPAYGGDQADDGPADQAGDERVGGVGDEQAGQARRALALQEVAQSDSASRCLALGERLAAAAPRVAMLAMGDGSARKALGVPGAADPLAEWYDSQVAAALAAGDTSALGGLDPGLDEELLVAGRAAWQVLAGAAAGYRIRSQLRYASAPLDVSYFVASWQLDRRGG
jgi:hypothetical protein